MENRPVLNGIAAGEDGEGLAAVARRRARLQQVFVGRGVSVDPTSSPPVTLKTMPTGVRPVGWAKMSPSIWYSGLAAFGDERRGRLVERLEEAGVGEGDDRDRLARAGREDHHVGGVAGLQLGRDLRVVGVGGVGDDLDLDAGLFGVLLPRICA